MATRRRYLATIVDPYTGNDVAAQTTYAWNSGIRATEALLREQARAEGILFTGGHTSVLDPDGVTASPDTPGATYRRVWQAGYRTLIATVREIR